MGTAPPVVNSFAIYESSMNWIAVTWTPVAAVANSPVTGYKIFRDSGQSLDNFVAVDTLPASSAFYNYTQLVQGRTYRFFIQSISNVTELNSLGITFPLSSSIILGKSGRLPLAPASLSLISSSTSLIRFSWPLPEDLGGFPLVFFEWRKDGGAWNNYPIGLGSQSPFILSDTAIVARRTYTYQVRTYTDVGYSTVAVQANFIAATTPSSPSGLTITSTGRGIVAMSWTAPNDNGATITHYNIYYSDATVQFGSVSVAGPFTTTHGNVSTLTAGMTYKFQVAAVNVLGESELSSTDFGIAAGPPKAPSNPVVTLAGAGAVMIRWGPPSDDSGTPVTGYELLWDAGSVYNFTTLFVSALDPTALSYPASGLIGGATYRVKVRAFNAATFQANAEQGVLSDAVSFVPASTPDAPSQPTFVNATRFAITVTWNTPGDGGATISGYILQTDDGRDSASPVFTQAYSGMNQFVTVTSNPGRTFRFRVAARNSLGLSAYSPVVSYISAVTPSTPPQPTIIARDRASVVMRVFPPTDDGGSPFTGFLLLKDDGEGGTFAVEKDFSRVGSFETTDFDVLDLTPGYTFRFKVRAVTSATLISNFPAAPESPILTVIAGISPSIMSAPTKVSSARNALTVSWSAPARTGGSPILGYRLYMNDGLGSQTFTQIYSSSNAITSFTVSGLATGFTYGFKISSFSNITEINSFGLTSDTPNLSPAEYFRCVGPPTAPSLFFQASTMSSVTFGWTYPTDDGGGQVLYYIIYMDNGLNNGVFNPIRSTSDDLVPTARSFTRSTNLISGLQYQFKVQAVNDGGIGPLSSAFGVWVVSQPSAPPAPVILSSSRTAFNLTWSPPTDLGGSPLLGYRLSGDDGNFGAFSTIWEDLLTGASFTAFNISDGLVVGKTYRYVVQASTRHPSLSPVSDAVFVVAADPPSPCLNLAVVGRSSSSLTIAWREPYDNGGSTITGYRVYMNDGTPSSALELAYNGYGKPSVLTYTTARLILGVTYKFQVSALNFNYEGARSTVASFVACLLPSSPVAPVVTAYGVSTVNISWSYTGVDDGGSPIIGYSIYLGLSNSTSYPQIATANSLDTAYSLINLDAGSSYKVCVAFQNVAGEGPCSNDFVFTAAVIPDPPINLRLTERGMTYSTISWDPPVFFGYSPLTGFKVYMNDFSGNGFLLAYDGDKKPNTLTFNQTGLSTGRTYVFRVNSVNVVGPSQVGADISVVCAPLPSAPSAPFLLSLTNTAISLAWAPPTFSGGILVTGYRLYLSSVVNGQPVGYSVVYDGLNQPSTLQATVSPLLTGNTYSFVVSAISAAGESPQSNRAIYITARVPDSPTNFRRLSSTTGSITLTWDAPADNGGLVLTGYEVWMDDGAAGALSMYWTGSAESVSVVGLSTGYTYRFQMRALNPIGSSAFTSALVLRCGTKPATPFSPFLFTTVKTSNVSMTAIIKWTAPSNNGGLTISGFKVFMDDGLLGPFQLVKDLTGFPSNVTYEALGMVLGRTYRAKVSALNDMGESDLSPEARIFIADVPSRMTTFSLLTSESTSSQFAVTWAAPSDNGGSALTGYTLYMDNGMGGDLTVAFDGSGYPSTTKYVSSGMGVGRTYKYFIRAQNMVGPGPLSPEYNLAITSVPSPARNLRLLSYSATSLTVAWDPPASTGSMLISYRVVTYNQVNLVQQSVQTTDITSSASVSISSLTTLRTYCFLVQTIAGVYATNSTALCNLIPQTVVTPPTAVTNFDVAFPSTVNLYDCSKNTGGSNKFTLTYTLGSTAASYTLYIDNGYLGSFTAIATAPYTANGAMTWLSSYSYCSFTPGTTYRYMLKPITSGGIIGASSAVKVLPHASPTVTVPSTNNAREQVIFTNSSLTLSPTVIYQTAPVRSVVVRFDYPHVSISQGSEYAGTVLYCKQFPDAWDSSNNANPTFDWGANVPNSEQDTPTFTQIADLTARNFIGSYVVEHPTALNFGGTTCNRVGTIGNRKWKCNVVGCYVRHRFRNPITNTFWNYRCRCFSSANPSNPSCVARVAF
eukprot:GILI01005732.1.p1 GENE.GILI01005732.1~~GILI01005732.1.p1  ORF type:complete len:2203 (+),score=253.12 GILI01005732.1:565-6609(+)